jgi:hypothetical protein
MASALSAEAIDLGRSYWILQPISCHTPEAVTTVFKCSWGWTQIASETCRMLLQLIINILPSCITLVLYIYILTYDARKIKHKMSDLYWHNQQDQIRPENCMRWPSVEHRQCEQSFEISWRFVSVAAVTNPAVISSEQGRTESKQTDSQFLVFIIQRN